MKKFIIMLLFFSASVFAQTMEKGTISLKFNDKWDTYNENIKVNIQNITLSKEDHFIVTARGESNNDSLHIMINVEMELYKVYHNTVKDEIAIANKDLDKDNLAIANTIDITSFELTFKNGEKYFEFSIMHDAKYGLGIYKDLSKKGKAIGLGSATQKFICKVTNPSIKTENNRYKISGDFRIILMQDNQVAGTIIPAEVKEGHFELII